MNKQKRLTLGAKIAIILSIFFVFLASLPFIIYLKVLPALVSNPKTIEFVEDYVAKNINANFKIDSPKLETSLKPKLGFQVKSINISKDNKRILDIKNLDIDICFSKLLSKEIALKKLGLDYLFLDTNKFIELLPQQQAEQKKSDFKFEWLDSVLYVKKCIVLYRIDQDTDIKVDGKNLEITSSRKPKFVHFDINVDLKKKKDTLRISFKDQNKIFIRNHKLFVDNFALNIDKSKVFVVSESDEKGNYDLTVYAHNFDLQNIIKLLNSNLVIPDGGKMLEMYKDLKGSFNFDINIRNNNINGIIKINPITLKLLPLSSLPVCLTQGEIKITPQNIFLNKFQGYYGASSKNELTLKKGVVNNYTSPKAQTHIKLKTKVTNEFTKNYLSKLAGIPITLTGPCTARITADVIGNKTDISWTFKVKKGKDILLDGASMSPTDYDRQLRGEMTLVGNELTIKKIDYYIAKLLNKKTRKNIKPILAITGKIDISTGAIKVLGFDIPKPLPSEFINVLAGQRILKKGTIGGELTYINTGNIPYLKGNMELKGVRIAGQRTSIKEGKLTTDKNLIHLSANGRFRKHNYKFSGNIKNEILFPIVVKDVDLTLPELDINKILISLQTPSKSQLAAIEKAKAEGKTIETSQNDNDDNDEPFIFTPNLIVIEKCMFNVDKGIYDVIHFGNLHANLTLTKNGILEIKSNKFDFAEGISSCKVYCDLMKHKYYVRLGSKDVNADLIATSLLKLKKEIAGKGSALIELSTDDSMRMNGSIKFIVKDGSIAKLGLVEYALKFAALFRNPLAMISPSTIIDLVNVPEGTFKSITGTMNINNNIVKRIDIRSSSPQLSSFIAGRYSLETGDASLRIYTKFSSKNKGFAGFLRNISLNSLANKVPLSSRNDRNYYAAELAKLPPLEDEEGSQIFLTKVEGDIQNNNFLSSLKKIK